MTSSSLSRRSKEWLAFTAMWLCLQIWLERFTSLGNSKHKNSEPGGGNSFDSNEVYNQPLVMILGRICSCLFGCTQAFEQHNAYRLSEEAGSDCYVSQGS